MGNERLITDFPGRIRVRLVAVPYKCRVVYSYAVREKGGALEIDAVL